jgi:hypothetical protein
MKSARVVNHVPNAIGLVRTFLSQIDWVFGWVFLSGSKGSVIRIEHHKKSTRTKLSATRSHYPFNSGVLSKKGVPHDLILHDT